MYPTPRPVRIGLHTGRVCGAADGRQWPRHWHV